MRPAARIGLAVAVTATLLLGAACTSGSDKTDRTDGTDSSSTANGLPGGTEGKALLAKERLLQDGKVATGLVAPKDPKVKAAICAYVFGTPDQVATTARLGDDVTLASGSGYVNAGGGGTGYRCIYAVGGTDTFLLRIWSDGSSPASGLKGASIVELPDGRTATAGYADTYDGSMAPTTTLNRWLKEAADRGGQASV